MVNYIRFFPEQVIYLLEPIQFMHFLLYTKSFIVKILNNFFFS